MTTILRDICFSIRKAHAKLMARIYAHYKTRSKPVYAGEHFFFFETYCPVIQNTCDNYGISIPTLAPKTPNRIVCWYLMCRLGWPWPIRLVSYKGKRLEFIALTPDEMANTMQGIWETSMLNAIQMEAMRPSSDKPEHIKKRSGEQNKNTSENSIKIDRIGNSLQETKAMNVSTQIASSSETSNKQISKETLTVLRGATIDYSF